MSFDGKLAEIGAKNRAAHTEGYRERKARNDAKLGLKPGATPADVHAAITRNS